MPLTVIATVGAANANSFQTVLEIDQYYEARVPTSVATQWLSASAANKDAAAVMATTWMTALINWTGYQTTQGQALPWPRSGMYTRDDWTYVSDSIIPQELKNAHAEFARILLAKDRLAESSVVAQGLELLKAGPITLMFKKGLEAPQIIPDSVLFLLPPSWIYYIRDYAVETRDLVRA